ncbi:mechanosensitive ion channel family protein [Solimonas fluminis]|nr:mechanosensitive ion channel family protein [Solimonas fluminis]
MDPQWLEAAVYGGTPKDWLVALGLSAAVALTVYLVKPILLRRLEAQALRSRTQIDDAMVAALRATRLWLVVIFALSIGSHYLTLPDRHGGVLKMVTAAAFFLQLGFWAGAALRFWMDRSRAKALASNASAATSLSAIGFLAQMVLWTVILLLVLDNFGINITALVAGLGIGGVAVALAVQNILGDLFASLSIVVDKPFVIGDFIIVDNYMGTVENVGLKTTRIRSLDGEQIVFSNSDLLKTRLRNYKRMVERRVVFSFGVSYDTSPEQIERIPPTIRRIIEGQPKVRFERAHFQKFGEYSLVFETVYWVTDPDYNLYMDIQQAVNLEIMRALKSAEVVFGLPRQSLVMERPLRFEAEGAPLGAGNGTKAGSAH